MNGWTNSGRAAEADVGTATAAAVVTIPPSCVAGGLLLLVARGVPFANWAPLGSHADAVAVGPPIPVRPLIPAANSAWANPLSVKSSLLLEGDFAETAHACGAVRAAGGEIFTARENADH